jgi:hypothetical protein
MTTATAAAASVKTMNNKYKTKAPIKANKKKKKKKKNKKKRFLIYHLLMLIYFFSGSTTRNQLVTASMLDLWLAC